MNAPANIKKRHRKRRQRLCEADVALAKKLAGDLGLKAVCVEARPGILRILSAEGQNLTIGDDGDELEKELREFRARCESES